MPSGQGNTPAFAIFNFNSSQTALRRNAPEIDFQQSCEMGRVMHILKRLGAMLGDQGQQAEQAELIRRADDHPASRLRQRDQFPHKLPGIFQMFDYLHGRDYVGASSREWNSSAVQIELAKLGLLGKMIVSHCIHAEVTSESSPHHVEEVALPATHVYHASTLNRAYC